MRNNCADVVLSECLVWSEGPGVCVCGCGVESEEERERCVRERV